MSSIRVLCSIGLLALAACGPQASEAYQGEPLLSVTGKVQIELERDDTDRLQPALAFHNLHDQLDILDVDVHGEFPASFTIDVYDPPPSGAFVSAAKYLKGEPKVALGYITAVTSDHPKTIDFASSAVASSSSIRCADGSEDDGTGSCPTVEVDQWCTEDGSNCYTETTTCPAGDNARHGCETHVEGDSALKMMHDPWDNFAGLSENYAVVYLHERAPAHTWTAQIFGAAKKGLDKGYHLLALSDDGAAGEEAADACKYDAGKLAAKRYNAAHDTEFSAEDLESGEYFKSCGDQPNCVGTFVPAPEDAVEDWHLLREEAQVELGCRLTELLIEPVAHPESEHITVRIGMDVRPID